MAVYYAQLPLLPGVAGHGKAWHSNVWLIKYTSRLASTSDTANSAVHGTAAVGCFTQVVFLLLSTPSGVDHIQ